MISGTILPGAGGSQRMSNGDLSEEYDDRFREVCISPDGKVSVKTDQYLSCLMGKPTMWFLNRSNINNCTATEDS